MTIRLGEQTICVFAPHPDDEILGAGGLISRALAESGRVTVVYGNVLGAARRAELERGLEVLSSGRPGHLDYQTLFDESVRPDGWHRSVQYHETLEAVEEILEDVAPSLVLAPDTDAYHQDHQLIGRAVVGATRPSGATGRHRPEIVALFEEPSDSWSGRPVRRNPNWYLALSDREVAAKCAAMEAHVSQNRPVPSERSTEAIRALARLRGAQAGVESAEAFHLLGVRS